MDQLRQFQSSRFFTVAVVFLGGFTDLCIYSVIIPIIPFILNDLNESESWIGVLLALYGVGIVAGSLLFGSLVYKGKISKKYGMVASLAILAAAITLFAVSKSIALFAFARFLQGFSSCGVWVLGLAFVADVYDGDEKNLGKVMSYIFTGLALGQLVGPPVGGWLYHYGQIYPFVFSGALVVLDLIGRLLIVEPSNMKEVAVASDALSIEASSIVTPTCETPSVKTLLNKDLIIICTMCFVFSVCFTQLEPTLPLYLNYLYLYNSAQIGSIWLAFVLPNIVGGLLGGWLYDKYGIRKRSVLAIPLAMLSLLFLAIPGPSNSIVWLSILLGYCGCIFGVIFAPVAPGISASVPKEYNTVGYVLMNLVFSLGIAVGPLSGGFLYEKIGWNWQQAIFAIIMVFIVPMGFWMPKSGSVVAVETSTLDSDDVSTENRGVSLGAIIVK
ncbi:UNVERIFIED_CONTAM: hypothetical protein HDU68_000474 [Siphonaria sp. JEL0065]|nr:hypothetical protein HDU68_000474 [Siphonaria sp. JEL0065]